MERGVVIGGILISTSFLFAVLLNHSADGPGPFSASIGEVSSANVRARLSGPAGAVTEANDSTSPDRATSIQPAKQRTCNCKAQRGDRCGQRRAQNGVSVHHVITFAGDEESIGVQAAIQHMQFNVDSCSGQCWVNHLADLPQTELQLRSFVPISCVCPKRSAKGCSS